MKEQVDQVIQEAGKLTRQAPYAALYAIAVCLLAAGSLGLLYFEARNAHEREQQLIDDLRQTRIDMMAAVQDQRERSNQLLNEFVKSLQKQTPTKKDEAERAMFNRMVDENSKKIDRMLNQLENMRVRQTGKGR